jgi:hypothetical protein
MHRDLARSRRVMDSASKRGAWHVQSLCYRGHAEVFSRDLDSARTSLQNAIELTRELGPNTVGRVAEQVDKLRDTIQSQSER